MDANAAREPNDLGRFLVDRINSGDVEGLVALYEPDAVLSFPVGSIARGHDEIRAVFAAFLAAEPKVTLGEQREALVSGDHALTSTRLAGGAVTAEVARRRPDGAWRWIIDQSNILG